MDAQRNVERARLLVRLLLAEVREAASDWRLEQSAMLPAAISQLCEGAQGLDIQLQIASELPASKPGTAHAIYRIVQEALTNTLRHSGARLFTVSLGTSALDWLELKVVDNGHGVAQVQRGQGLRGMEDRVRELGGTMSISSQPGGGFTIHVLIPAPRSLTS